MTEASNPAVPDRMVRPTIGRKFTLLFTVILLIGIASGLAVDKTLGRLDGAAAQINLAGSLRWMARDAEVELRRFATMNFRDRQAIELRLQRADQVLAILMRGGVDNGAHVPPLPAALLADVAELESDWREFRKDALELMNAVEHRADAAGRLGDLHRRTSLMLANADRITGALTEQVESVRGEVRDTLLRLALIDGAFLLAGLLALRLQIVRPVGRLAAMSERIAQGRYGERLGYDSRDEIGQLAASFDHMAERIQQDIGQMSADNRKLRETQRRLLMLSQAIEHSPAAVIVTDAEGVIEHVNPKFVEMTGYSAEEAIGQRPSMLKSGLMPSSFFTDMWQALRAGEEWRGHIHNRKKNGELFWEDTWISAVRDDEGRIVHYIAVKEDVTEKRQLEDERARLNETLEQRVAQRTEQLSAMVRELEAFSYSVSHDLRTPLRSIHGFASLMSEACADCVNSEAQDCLARIRRASVRMGDIIDDLLDLSRISRSRLQPVAVDLSAVARAVLDDLAERDPARAVRVDIAPGMLVTGDAGLLRLAMENLIGNAWKFTAGRQPAEISIGLQEDEGEAAVFVRDNGAGFDMQYANKLFLPFQRLHKPEEFEGNGIGLATVKKIINLHGGRLWAESLVGKGAVFHFTLPAKLPDFQSGHAAQHAAA
jgi:PAS domain S-box-containing protein